MRGGRFFNTEGGRGPRGATEAALHREASEPPHVVRVQLQDCNDQTARIKDDVRHCTPPVPRRSPRRSVPPRAVCETEEQPAPIRMVNFDDLAHGVTPTVQSASTARVGAPVPTPRTATLDGAPPTRPQARGPEARASLAWIWIRFGTIVRVMRRTASAAPRRRAVWGGNNDDDCVEFDHWDYSYITDLYEPGCNKFRRFDIWL